MSSDHGSLLSYFSRTESSSESAPPCTDDAPVPQSDVGSAGYAGSEPESSLVEEILDETVNEPYQPRDLVFPPCKFGIQSRSFQPGWFDKWTWLDWDDRKDSVYCHPCRMAVRLKFTLSNKAEPAFSESGF